MNEVQTLELPDLPRYLTDILYQYQQGNDLCDCHIVTNNGTIPAHSLVLLITCPFFNGTRTFDCTRGMTFTVPFNMDDVETVVRLLYTGKLTVSKENIEQIVDICHYLQLKEALSLCRKYIERVPCKEEIKAIESNKEYTETDSDTVRQNVPQPEPSRAVDYSDSVAIKSEESGVRQNVPQPEPSRAVDYSDSVAIKSEECSNTATFTTDNISDERPNNNHVTLLYDWVNNRYMYVKFVSKPANNQPGTNSQTDSDENNPQLTGNHPQSLVINPQSADIKPQCTVNNPQPSVNNSQSIGNPQSSVNNPQSSMINPQI
ncbi:hypothetical protein FSP39_001372 [Pinctada imbricata]|uniref:BTB domain-containing protein n=1 Tax=Pinctada imbricata TaxID=66713 RepID=A0AA88XIZ0_PINIB|nr:hypothetical protein FSP39_001372 [Pinctada imbricata]